MSKDGLADGTSADAALAGFTPRTVSEIGAGLRGTI